MSLDGKEVEKEPFSCSELSGAASDTQSEADSACRSESMARTASSGTIYMVASSNISCGRHTELLGEHAVVENGPPCEGSVPEPGDANVGRPQGQPCAKADDRTTVMLRNLPNNYTRAMVLAMLDQEGFAGLYDFLYLPIDFKSGACLGYAFVNLVEAAAAADFWRVFDGYSSWAFPSRKVCHVSWSAPTQGLLSHVERYRNSPIMHESVPDERKPMVFQNGEHIAFPEPTKVTKAPRQRCRGGERRAQISRCLFNKH